MASLKADCTLLNANELIWLAGGCWQKHSFAVLISAVYTNGTLQEVDDWKTNVDCSFVVSSYGNTLATTRSSPCRSGYVEGVELITKKSMGKSQLTLKHYCASFTISPTETTSWPPRRLTYERTCAGVVRQEN
jgi:hypothetical protein